MWCWRDAPAAATTRGYNVCPRPPITWRWRSEALFMSVCMPVLWIGFINLFLLKCHTRGAPYAPWNEPKDLQVPFWVAQRTLFSFRFASFCTPVSSCNSLLHLKRSKRKKKKGNFCYYTVHFQFCMPNADGFIELFSQVSHLNVLANCKRMPDFHPLGFMQIVEILTYGCEHFMVIIFPSNLSREWGVYDITPFNASLKTPTVEEVKYVSQLM